MNDSNRFVGNWVVLVVLSVGTVCLNALTASFIAISSNDHKISDDATNEYV